jgi:hypothetical protein
MKAYTAFLDMLILLFLLLAIHFNVTDNYITNPTTGRRGVVSIMIISWQTFFVAASFCVFLRYIAETFNKEKA